MVGILPAHFSSPVSGSQAGRGRRPIWRHSRPQALKPKCRWPAALRGLGEDGGRGPGLWARLFLQAGRPWKLLYEVDHLEPCLGVGRRAGRRNEGQASSLLPLPTQPGSPGPYRTRPLVFRSTEAAKLWVTPTRLVPSTSTRRSFTWILGEATLVRGGLPQERERREQWSPSVRKPRLSPHWVLVLCLTGAKCMGPEGQGSARPATGQ